MTDPAWMTIARTFIGVREIPGPRTNPTIAGWLKSLKAWWTDDATPWCGVTVAYVMQQAGQPIPKAWFRAKAWATWGKPCQPCLGAVLVFDRAGGGHVAFYTAERADAYQVLGGNQGDAVSLSWIAKNRLVAARWPLSEAVTTGKVMRESAGGLSRNEQ